MIYAIKELQDVLDRVNDIISESEIPMLTKDLENLRFEITNILMNYNCGIYGGIYEARLVTH